MRSRSDPGRGTGPPRYPGTFLVAFGEAVGGFGWRLHGLERDIAQCTNAGGEARAVNLEPLYQLARRTPRADWPQLITVFLRTLERTSGEEQSNESAPEA